MRCNLLLSSSCMFGCVSVNSYTGTNSASIKEDVKNTVNYIKANEKTILDERHSIKETDLNIQISNVLGNNITAGIGGAVYVAILSAICRKSKLLGGQWCKGGNRAY